MSIEEKLQRFCEVLTKENKERLIIEGFSPANTEYFIRHAIAHYHIGNKYARVDVGDSGRYMVELDTERIYGIKGYGVIHRGHSYGTLDTIDDYYWGRYRAVKRVRHDNPSNITPNKAKSIVKKALDERGFPYTRLTARTIGFSDLARDTKMFVTIHGWVGNPRFEEIRSIARQNGFIVDTSMSNPIYNPSHSRSQQQLFGVALAMKRGEIPMTKSSAGHIAATMSEKKIKEFTRMNPKSKKSLSDRIIALDMGELEEEERINTMQEMINSGLCWQMPGRVGREASDMIEAGLCVLGKVGHKDYYGNYVPSRYEVKSGTKGSMGYAKNMSGRTSFDNPLRRR